jgi:diguanylate cyclase (GGDEF)-like protein
VSEPDHDVLVVDDDDGVRQSHARSLQELPGVRVVEAATGRQALELAGARDYFMFLLDTGLPDLSGYDLASRLRLEPRAHATPIVFVAPAGAGHGPLEHGYRAGAADVLLSAPVPGAILRQKARVFLQLHRKRLELEALIRQTQDDNLELGGRVRQLAGAVQALAAPATLDPLTQLPGTTLFLDRLHGAAARASRAGRRFAVACVDLEGFSAVNRHYGRGVGDAVLVAAARRLTHLLRGTDTVARVGSDHFALLLEGLSGVADAERVAGKVFRGLVGSPLLRAGTGGVGTDLGLGASMGVAVYPDHAREAEDLVTLADLTLYAVKHGGGGLRFYPGAGGPADPGPAPAR